MTNTVDRPFCRDVTLAPLSKSPSPAPAPAPAPDREAPAAFRSKNFRAKRRRRLEQRDAKAVALFVRYLSEKSAEIEARKKKGDRPLSAVAGHFHRAVVGPGVGRDGAGDGRSRVFMSHPAIGSSSPRFSEGRYSVGF